MQISANGIAIEVEDHGPPAGEPLLLIMGLGMQLTAWPDGFVARLVEQGFRVIRFDNRDAGLSQSFDHAGVPNVGIASFQHLLRLPIRSPYSVADMARDAVGVLDALGIARAHVCGASMGGMIAQHLAIDHPERVQSLTLMMTTSGARGLPGPSMKVRAALLGRPADPKSRDSVVAHYMNLYRLIGSPGYPPPEAQLRERIAASIARSSRPKGIARQIVAIAADHERARRVREIRRPTLVLHGQDDALIPVAAAHDLARRIEGSRMDLIGGWGHDLPEELWPRLVDGIAATAERA